MAEPLEFKEFSGGITENIIDASVNRYARADNFLITTDKNLIGRPAFIQYSNANYILPSGNQRVNGIFTCINESILLAQSGRSIYQVDPIAQVWTAITGPSGNQAIGSGDINSQNTPTEFQRQVYLTNDGIQGVNGSQPVKLYRNTSNAWVANTAGMPRSYVQPTYSSSSLLSTCIALANNLATSMQAHFQDSRYTTYNTLVNDPGDPINLHTNVDKYSLSYFAAQTFNALVDPETPSVIPTPIASCSTQATLFQLITAINNAFTHHMTDATYSSLQNQTFVGGSLRAPFYHPNPQPGFNQTTFYPRGPLFGLTNNTAPTTLAQAAAMLDDLVTKWYWHRFSIWTHSPTNDPVQMDRYNKGLSHIVPPSSGISYTTALTYPVVTGDFTDVYNYVNNLKYLYNSHVLNINGTQGYNPYAHKQPDNAAANANWMLQINLPDCNSFDTMTTMLFWLRNMYYLHAVDANQAINLNVTFNSGAGTNTLSSVVRTDTGAAYTLPVGSWLMSGDATNSITGTKFTVIETGIRGDLVNSTGFVARVTASSSGAATLDRNCITGQTGNVGQSSYSWYHQSSQPTTVTTSNFISSLSSVMQIADALTTSPNTVGGTDFSSWLTLASELTFCLVNHMADGPVHWQSHYNQSSAVTVLTGKVPYAPFFIPVVSQVSYAFFFSYAYTVESNGIQYLNQGNPLITASTYIGVSYPVGTGITSLNVNLYPSTTTTSQRTNVLSNLPVLVNDASTNYDAANIMLNIYRTTNGGTTYFQVAQVANGTTTYNDVTNDTLANPGGTSLALSQTMYTTGGVVGSDQPPQCKFMHIFLGTAYYAGITQNNQFFPQRILQAVQFAPDWAPATFTDDMDEAITGISSTRDNVVVFGANSIYRVSGGFNTLGQGALTHTRIADQMGCQNAKSVVKTEVGVFFAGNDGFYFTDGYQLINLTLELKKTYALLTATPAQVRSIYGAYDKLTRRVWWALKTSPTDSANSVFYTFYLDYGLKPSGTFTTASNYPYILPASHVFQQGTMYVGHELGFILKSDASTKADVIPVVGVTASLWNQVYIPYNFTSSGTTMGTVAQRKYLTKLHVTGANSGNVAMQINAIRDLNASNNGIVPMAPVNYTDNDVWGNPLKVWGDAGTYWNNTGKMDIWRRFGASSLRANIMQVQFVPQYIAVYSSSVNYPVGSNVSINATAKTATILTPPGYSAITFMADVVGYTIYFDTDGYIQGYPITALDVTQKIITYTDVANKSVTNSSMQWVIRGYKKQQRPSITSFAIHYQFKGDKTQSYPGSTSNSGPGNAGENPS